MGCYLEVYRATVGFSVGKFSWCDDLMCGDAKQTTGDYLVLIVPSSMILAVLLKIVGFEQNPGPVEVVGTTVRLLCAECGRNLQTGIQYDLCERRYHYCCGRVKY